MPTAKHLKLVREHLKSFSLDMDNDIATALLDGARHMEKLGNEISQIHSMCMEHANHLSRLENFLSKPNQLALTFENSAKEDSYFELVQEKIVTNLLNFKLW